MFFLSSEVVVAVGGAETAAGAASEVATDVFDEDVLDSRDPITV